MAEDNKSIRNGIIVTVVGGLIIAAIKNFAPSIWTRFSAFINIIFDFSSIKLELSAWLFILLLGLSVYPLSKLAQKILSFFRKVIPNKQTFPLSEIQEYPQEQKTPAIFSNEEKFTLAILIKADDRKLTFEEIVNGINSTNIRTRHALDELRNKCLVEKYSRNSFGLAKYGLTCKGRELVVERDWDKIFNKDK